MAVEHGLETGRLPLVGVFDGMRWKIQDKEAGGDKYGKIGKLNLDLVYLERDKRHEKQDAPDVTTPKELTILSLSNMWNTLKVCIYHPTRANGFYQ